MKIWKLAVVEEEALASLSRALDLPRPIVRALAARQLQTPDAIGDFLSPALSRMGDPFDLPGLTEAVDRVWQAIDAQEPILVHGDYDVDGISATALLVSVLRALGAESVTPCLPNRLEEGYGISLAALQEAWPAGDGGGRPPLVITADCGTAAHEAVAWIAARGGETIVTDHHEPTGEPAAARTIINPKLTPDSPHAGLAGVGVAFKLCHGLVKRGRQRKQEGARHLDIRRYLDWVALGTIADVVPLTGENRVLTRQGLIRLNEDPSIGMEALIRVAGLRKPIHAGLVGFGLAPRLNAAGRLGHPGMALDLLLSSDREQARQWAEELNQANRRRQEIEGRILEEAVRQVDRDFRADRDFGVVVGGEGWHPGVIGIVASRLVGKYGRPAVVVSFEPGGEGRGSGRGIPGFDLVKGLTACAEHLGAYGGHAQAAGLTVRRDRFESFQKAFGAVCRSALSEETVRPVQWLDAWIDTPEEIPAILEVLPQMGPFGAGNPEPVWGVRGVRKCGAVTVLKEVHARFPVVLGDGDPIEAIAFQQAHRPIPEEPFEMAVTLEWNRFGGGCRPQMVVKDFRPESAAAG